MSEKSPTASHRIEAFAVRLGTVAILLGLSFFGTTIGFGLLVLEVRLSAYLRPLGQGVTLAAMAMGILISGLVSRRLWPFVKHVSTRISQVLVTDVDFEGTLSEVRPVWALLSYAFFAFTAFGMYRGLHGYALRGAHFFGHRSRVIAVESPSLTVALWLLDWGSAMAAVALLAFVVAIDARIYGVGSRHLPARLVRWPGASGPPVRTLLPTTATADGPDSTRVIHDFAIRIAIGSLVVGILSVGIHSLLSTVQFRTLSIEQAALWIGGAVGALLLGVSLCGFLVGVTPSTAVDVRWIRRLRDDACRVVTLRGSRPLVATLIGWGYVAVGVALYLFALTALPTPRDPAPPLVASPFELDRGSGLAASLELARISGVLAALSATVPLSYRGREWWDRSRLPGHASEIWRVAKAPLASVSAFTDKISGTQTDATTRWSAWVRAGLLAQFFGAAFLLQAISHGRPLIPTGSLFVIGVLGQAVAGWADLRVRYGSVSRTRATKLVAIVVVPPLGGIAYVTSEY